MASAEADSQAGLCGSTPAADEDRYSSSFPQRHADGNAHDNAATESFFRLLKRERIRRRIYSNHDEARADAFQYIEMFYNPKRRHSTNDGLSSIEFEKQYALNG